MRPWAVVASAAAQISAWCSTHLHEAAGLQQRPEREGRRTADAFIQRDRRAAARFGDDPRAAIVAGHQRRLRSGERQIIITLRSKPG